MRVLLVEDDDSIGDPLAAALAKEGFDVGRARTATEASTADLGVDLVLLDLGLPDGDGFAVCRSMRARSSVPIIVVTARGEEVDRVVGLELGADDYVVKPFGQRELLARIRAVLRRATPGNDDPVVRVGALEIDRRTRRVSVGGADVTLTRKEYDLLALLAEDAGAVRTRDEILERVWDPHWYGPTKTLDVHVASLRRKLGDPTLVETVRGVGFRLRADG
jgi:two-component system, OmpR family, response regulator RegX3